MRIAVVQMEVLDGNPEGNRNAFASYLDQNSGCDLYLAPELWTSGYVQQQWTTLAAEDTSVTLAWMSEQARSRNVWLGGSLIAADLDGTLANRFVLFDRNGDLACRYDKAHLFRPLQEEVFLQAGKTLPPIIEAEGVKLSPAICYDLRFPEMFRRIALQGVDVFLVSSEWPFPRQHALRTLTEARAVENQAVVALANRVGPDSQGNNFCGGSGIFGPLGVLTEVNQAGGVAMADINVEELHQLRSSFPVMSHRRKGIDYE